jgi:hypothetical protein
MDAMTRVRSTFSALVVGSSRAEISQGEGRELVGESEGWLRAFIGLSWGFRRAGLGGVPCPSGRTRRQYQLPHGLARHREDGRARHHHRHAPGS